MVGQRVKIIGEHWLLQFRRVSVGPKTGGQVKVVQHWSTERPGTGGHALAAGGRRRTESEVGRRFAPDQYVVDMCAQFVVETQTRAQRLVGAHRLHFACLVARVDRIVVAVDYITIVQVVVRVVRMVRMIGFVDVVVDSVAVEEGRDRRAVSRVH